MGLSLYDAGVIARDGDFQLRVAMAAYRVAHEVINEGDGVSGHPLRLNFARAVLNQNMDMFSRYATMIVAMPEVYQAEILRQQDIPDEKIEGYLEDIWNDLAGYDPTQTTNPTGVAAPDHTHENDVPLAQPSITVYQP